MAKHLDWPTGARCAALFLALVVLGDRTHGQPSLPGGAPGGVGSGAGPWAATGSSPAVVCVGDCGNNGAVTIDELLKMVNVALGYAQVAECAAGDPNHDGSITIDELIRAVNNALSGCPSAGVLLSGDPGRLATAAMVEMPPVPADPSDVDNGIIMTRLDLHLRPTATVGEVNAALTMVGGGIVTMLPGFPAVTIAIPRPASLADLAQVAETLNQAPGILRASLAREPRPAIVPSSDPDFLNEIFYLTHTRFPAAWNAKVLLNGCEANKVPVWVVDYFGQPRSPEFGQAVFSQFLQEIDQSIFVPINGWSAVDQEDPGGTTHGYEVTTTLGALFDGPNLTGADPFPNCLDINGMALDGLSSLQVAMQIASLIKNAPPNTPIITNHSYGYNNECAEATECDANDYAQMPPPLDRAYEATNWKALTQPFWGRFLVHSAAGNERDTFSAFLYPALGMASYASEMNMATMSDPLYPGIADAQLWGPMAASAKQYEDFRFYVSALGMDTVLPANNGLTVGSTTSDPAHLVQESTFSNSGPDVKAAGEEVFTFEGVILGGTSLATPQVAGLASYLWLLSPDLRTQPTWVTRRAILENARANDYTTGIIDAYATVLSLDPPAAPAAADAPQGPADAPVRLAILDVNEDDKFNEADVSAFLSHYEDPVTHEPVDPSERDHSRFDLNGDGFTGGRTYTPQDRFDLDTVGSTQYGGSIYGRVRQNIDDASIAFDENVLTDLQILCYYAYSPLYTGDTDRRKELLQDKCNIPVSLDVTYALADASSDSPYCDDDIRVGVEGAFDRPVALPVTVNPSCGALARSQMKLTQLAPNHIAMDFSMSARGGDLTGQWSPNGAVAIAEGHIPAGNYRLTIPRLIEFLPTYVNQRAGIYFDLYRRTRRPVAIFSCVWEKGTLPSLACRLQPLEFDIVVRADQEYVWRFTVFAYSKDVSEEVRISGRVLSIQKLE